MTSIKKLIFINAINVFSRLQLIKYQLITVQLLHISVGLWRTISLCLKIQLLLLLTQKKGGGKVHNLQLNCPQKVTFLTLNEYGFEFQHSYLKRLAHLKSQQSILLHSKYNHLNYPTRLFKTSTCSVNPV